MIQADFRLQLYYNVCHSIEYIFSIREVLISSLSKMYSFIFTFKFKLLNY